MRTHLLLALVFACACARAQAPFEKIYDTGVAHKYNIMELGSQNLLVAMGCGRGISRLDPNGNVIQFKCFWGDTVIHISSIRKYSDNEFYFVAGYYKDTCTAGALGLITKIHPAIGRMDSVGNITSFRYYVFNGPSCINSASDLEITSAAGVITWGRDSRFFALRTDPAGAPVWA